MLKRKATAHWQGTGKAGAGTLSAPGGVLNTTPYSFSSRFAEGVSGTNPEELLAASHAGCFTMAVAFALEAKGFTAQNLETEATVSLDKTDAGMSVVGVHLLLTGSAAGLATEEFAAIAESAKTGCIISRALAVPVTLEIK